MANSNAQPDMGKNAHPTVSVIMSMRNAAATVDQAIRSLQWQTLTDWELILFDDGSRDASVQIAESFGDPRIRLQVDGESRGLATRLNQAVGIARAALIARMDADDVCFPERLAKQVTFLVNNPDVDVVACGAVVFSEDGTLIGLMPAGGDHRAIVARPFQGFPFPHPTWCGRVDWFRNNPYDPKLLRAQDQELLLRCYSRSSLAGLQDVLLGYRQERIDIGKSLRGRWVYVRALRRHGRAHGSLFAVFKGIVTHVMKGIADAMMLGLGLSRFSQRLRLVPVSENATKAWVSLWQALRPKNEAPVDPALSAASTPMKS